MKFRDGYWRLRRGVTHLGPVHVRDVRIERDSVTLYAATSRVDGRGDTINTALLTTLLDSPGPDVIRVRTYNHKGKARRGPWFAGHDLPPVPLAVTETGRKVEVASGNLQANVSVSGYFSLSFDFAGKGMTRVLAKDSGYYETEDGTSYMSEQLSLSVGENVYGLGERFTPFVKNGQVVDIWNRDGGTSSEQAYKNIPFYLTNRGYGVFVAHPELVSFEVASEVVSAVQFAVQGEYIEYYVIGGGTPKEVLSNYTTLTGRPALPPAWSFGLWLSTSFTTDYNEETVNRFVDGMIHRGVPLHVFHFDCFWMKEFQWVDLQWDRDAFPDPQGMLKRLKDRGLRISLWINPYVAQKSPLFDEGVEKGYLLKRTDGSVFQWDQWQPGMALVDFTNSGAVEWFKEKLRRLLEMGVDVFKTDFGERIPTDVVYADGSDPLKMHNYYTYLYNRCVFELIGEVKGQANAVVFARSATAGSQKFPVHWGGDCTASYESMAESLRGGLSLGLCGFGFWSHDISGFEQTATPDLYKRWVAFGLLSSHSRLHGSESYRVPWLFDEEATEVLRRFTELKCRLMPYLFASAVQATESGVPMMRAMVLEFPSDPTCAMLDRQYMLGEMLLVAPVFSADGEVTYYVPEGTWTNFLTNERIVGGRWHAETHAYTSLPLLVRPNGAVVVGADPAKVDYDFAEGFTLHLFELDEHSAQSTTIFDTASKRAVEIDIRREGPVVTVDSRGRSVAWSVCLRNVAEVSGVVGGGFSKTAEGIVISADPGSTTIKVALG